MTARHMPAGLMEVDAPNPAPKPAPINESPQAAPLLQPVTPELILQQQTSHSSKLRGLLSLPEQSQPVKALSGTPAKAEEAKPQPLSAPHGGHSQQPKPERRHLVQRALFKDVDREPEIQPAPEPSLAPPVRLNRTEATEQELDTHGKVSSTPATGPATAVAVGSKDNTAPAVVSFQESSLGTSEAAEDDSLLHLVRHISPHKPARKWRSHSLEYESKLQKHGGRRYHSLPEEAAQSYLHSLGEGTIARERPPLKPEVLPKTADLPEANATSRAESKHPALALQPAGSAVAEKSAQLFTAPLQASEVVVTFEAEPATDPESRGQLHGQPEGLATSSRAGVTYEAPGSSESSGLENKKASVRPGWPFSPPEPRTRVGIQLLEAGKYEGEINGSRIDGLGVLTKEGGGSFAGKVSDHPPACTLFAIMCTASRLFGRL